MTFSVFTNRHQKFRELLTKHRKDAGMTQQVLAERLGAYVSKYKW